MKTILRILLLPAMLWLAFQSVMAYTFDFRDGYSLVPLFALAACFSLFIRLRPQNAKPKPVVYTSQSMDSFLFLLLAVAGAAYVLDLRGERSFQPLWYLHLSTLTFFLLLLPSIAAYSFTRRHTLVTALASLLLLGLLWKGSGLSRPIKMPTPSANSEMSFRPTSTPVSTRVLRALPVSG